MNNTIESITCIVKLNGDYHLVTNAKEIFNLAINLGLTIKILDKKLVGITEISLKGLFEEGIKWEEEENDR